MNKRRHERVSKACVDRMFEDMQNPEYQGRAFTWENFPNLVKGMVETNLFMYYARQPANFEELKIQAGQHAFDYASELVAKNKDTLVVFAKKSPRP